MPEKSADYVIGKVIEGNTVRGRISLPGRPEPVDATFDPGVEKADDDWDGAVAGLIAQAKTLIDELRPDRLSVIVHDAAQEITDAAYEQSDHRPEQADYDRITKNCRLVEVGFFPGGAMLVFDAPDAFAGERIYIQIDDTLEIEDITVN